MSVKCQVSDEVNCHDLQRTDQRLATSWGNAAAVGVCLIAEQTTGVVASVPI